MTQHPTRSICWLPTWNKTRKGLGLEHLILHDSSADSVVLAFDERGDPFRLVYRLVWNQEWQLRSAHFTLVTSLQTRTLSVETVGSGRWRHSGGRVITELDQCLDIDVWPTPFTNTFPIRRQPLAVGERREFRVAWVNAPAMTIEPQMQAYTRLEDRLYLFENLDGSGFKAELPVDGRGVVLDYPKLFQRI